MEIKQRVSKQLIKREIKKFIETNDNENMITQNLRDLELQQKQF